MKKQEYIQRFRDLYKKNEGKDLTDQEAIEHFEKLVVLVGAVYQSIPKKFFEESCCPICGDKIIFEKFKDLLSVKEFLISSLCQNCQNKTFK